MIAANTAHRSPTAVRAEPPVAGLLVAVFIGLLGSLLCVVGW